MSQFFNQKGKITSMKKFFQRIWALTLVTLIVAAIAAVLGFLVGVSVKVFQLAYGIWS